MKADNKAMSEEITLLRDSDWAHVDSELCLVKNFSPMPGNKVEGGKAISLVKYMPYASVEIECALAKAKITGFVTHSMDFINLWSVFIERGIRDDEEVVMLWSRKHYKHFASKMFGAAFPKIWVLVCPKGSYRERAITWQTLRQEKDAWNSAASILSARYQVKPEVIA